MLLTCSYSIEKTRAINNMEKNYKYSLQERLNYYVECKNNWLEYFKHEEVNEKAEKRLFGNNIIFYLVMELYFLPINLLKYKSSSTNQPCPSIHLDAFK